MRFIRKHLPALSAVAVMTLLAGAPAIAAVVNAQSVDGFSAVGYGSTVTQRKGKLVATSTKTGRLPNNIIAKAPNSAKLGGILPGAYTLDSEAVDWARLLSVPADLADGDQTGPTYTAGNGINIIADVLTADLSVLQARVAPAGCAAGSSIRSIAADGSVTCQVDSDTNSGGDITAVNTGSGLQGGGTSGDLNLSVAPDSITAAMLGTGSVIGGFGGDVQDGTIDTNDLADNNVSSTDIANGTIDDIDISNAMALSIASISTTAASTFNGAVQVNNSLTATGNITGGNFLYGAVKAGKLYSDPADCQRASGAPYQDVTTAHPFGIGISNPANGAYSFYCPVDVQVPPGATFVLTGGNVWVRDSTATCGVAAAPRAVLFGTSAGGGAGVDTTVGYVGGGIENRPFPAFTNQILPNEAPYVEVTITNSGGGGNCQYIGGAFDYTVDRP